MRAADIEKLIAISRPTLSPAGDFAVFATSRPDIRANRNVGQLWRIDLGAGADPTPRRITRGVADSAPRVSPDGSAVAFVREDDKKRAQLHVVAASGGEPVQVTDQPLGVGSFAWSPDGARLAFTARVPDLGRYGSVEGLDASAEAPRRITGVRWHANGVGYTLDRPSQVFIVDASGAGDEPIYPAAPAVRAEDGTAAPVVPAAPTALTSGPAEHGGVVFTPDGAEVLTVVDEIEYVRRDLRSRVIAVRVDGTGERQVLDRGANLAVDDVAVADDGTIAILAAEVGADGVDFIAPPVALWVIESGGPRRLTDPDVVDLGEAGSRITVVGDVPRPEPHAWPAAAARR